MYLASVGGTGIRDLACLNFDKAEYLKRGLKGVGCALTFDSPTFNEFVVEFPHGLKETYRKLLEKRIVAGVPLATWYPERADHALLCVTEKMSREDMDALIQEVGS
jgi:glycine dehydrogenase subunit 1